jgi:hypothetical protein
MKRTELARRTPLPPRRARLTATTSPHRTTRINPVSAKRQAANRVRAKRVAEMRAEDPRCAMCGRDDVITHGHERLARSQGGDITNPDCLLCNRCNTWCEDNPREAARLGWKISRKWDQGE